MLEKSTLVSGLIALGVVGAIIYLSITGQVIPDLLGNSALIIIGFFFGSKVQNTGQSAIDRMVKHG
jgi:hypothetical protein